MLQERQMIQPVEHHYLVSIPETGRQLPLLIALHGYGGDMTSMMRVGHKIAAGGMAVAAPQGPHQFWGPSGAAEAAATGKVGFGWLTSYRSADSRRRHHALIRAIIEELAAQEQIDADSVFLMGFSQACALNYRFAFTHPGAVRGVVGICGGLPGDFSPARYQAIEAGILHIAGSRDPYYKPERTRTYAAALGALAPDVTFKEYASEHRIPPRSLAFIRKWMLERSRNSDHDSRLKA